MTLLMRRPQAGGLRVFRVSKGFFGYVRTLPRTLTGGPCTCCMRPSAAANSEDLPLPVMPTIVTRLPLGTLRSMSTSDAGASVSQVNSPASRIAVSPARTHQPLRSVHFPQVDVHQRRGRLGVPGELARQPDRRLAYAW